MSGILVVLEVIGELVCDYYESEKIVFIFNMVGCVFLIVVEDLFWKVIESNFND